MGNGGLDRTVDKYDVQRNARRRLRIHSSSNPTSDMSKCMNYISDMDVKAGIASITEGNIKIHRICK